MSNFPKILVGFMLFLTLSTSINVKTEMCFIIQNTTKKSQASKKSIKCARDPQKTFERTRCIITIKLI